MINGDTDKTNKSKKSKTITKKENKIKNVLEQPSTIGVKSSSPCISNTVNTSSSSTHSTIADEQEFEMAPAKKKDKKPRDPLRIIC